jgi:hypothetical protein
VLGTLPSSSIATSKALCHPHTPFPCHGAPPPRVFTLTQRTPHEYCPTGGQQSSRASPHTVPAPAMPAPPNLRISPNTTPRGQRDVPAADQRDEGAVAREHPAPDPQGRRSVPPFLLRMRFPESRGPSLAQHLYLTPPALTCSPPTTAAAELCARCEDAACAAAAPQHAASELRPAQHTI